LKHACVAELGLLEYSGSNNHLVKTYSLSCSVCSGCRNPLRYHLGQRQQASTSLLANINMNVPCDECVADAPWQFMCQEVHGVEGRSFQATIDDPRGLHKPNLLSLRDLRVLPGWSFKATKGPVLFLSHHLRASHQKRLCVLGVVKCIAGD
jgi:hypothetical protein